MIWCSVCRTCQRFSRACPGWTFVHTDNRPTLVHQTELAVNQQWRQSVARWIVLMEHQLMSQSSWRLNRVMYRLQSCLPQARIHRRQWILYLHQWRWPVCRRHSPTCRIPPRSASSRLRSTAVRSQRRVSSTQTDLCSVKPLMDRKVLPILWADLTHYGHWSRLAKTQWIANRAEGCVAVFLHCSLLSSVNCHRKLRR